MIPIHATATADPQQVRWVVEPGRLPARGAVRRAPGRLGGLLDDGVLDHIEVRPADVLITLHSGSSWREVGDDVRQALSDALLDPAGWHVEPVADDTAGLAAVAAELLAGPIGALAESHGGSIELVSIEGDQVSVRLSGACHGCPAATGTLHDNLQGELRLRSGRQVTVKSETDSTAMPLIRRLLSPTVRRSPRDRSLHAATRQAIGEFADTLRPLGSALVATARQVSTRRLMLTAVVVIALVAVALLVRLPSAVELRDWSTSMGSWLPLAFLGAHIVVTVLPFPRTAFTLAAGMLFGPLLGVTLAVAASTISAMIALALVRAAGWQLNRLVRHHAVERVDARLRERGWVAVISLRLIPVVPFAPLNYAVGASGVRVLGYLWATVAGLLPGTSAVVILGDALTGHVHPLLFMVSLCTGIVGVGLFAYEIRRFRQHHHPAAGHVDDAAETVGVISLKPTVESSR